jgi:hypothetical protein
VLAVLALSILFLVRIPFLGQIRLGPVLKLLAYTVPAFIIFLSRGYANAWVGAIFGINPANIPFAYSAATLFVASLALMTVLLGMTFIFEMLIIFPAVLPDKAIGSNSRRIGLIFVVGISFVACLAAYHALERLPSDSLGRLFITAIAYRFDSMPPTFCAITEEEAEAAQGDSPRLVAIFLSTNQEKAVLYQSSEPVLDPIAIYGFDQEQSERRRLKAVRVAECFKDGQPPINLRADAAKK